MTTTTVLHAVDAPPGSVVTYQLVVPAFDADHLEVLSTVKRIKVARDGSCTMRLTPNSELTKPAGTWWLITNPDGSKRTISVPVSGSAVQLDSILIDNPAAPGLVVVTLAGGVELASAMNTSSAATYAAGPGLGTAVDVPGCVITVPPSSGRGVYLRFGGTAVQLAVGGGDGYLSAVDVATGLGVGSSIRPLPNTADPTSYIVEFWREVRLLPITAARTFKLSLQLYSNGNPTLGLLNQPTNESYLRAVTA